MTENRPAPLEVTVHVAGRDGKIRGNPLPIANPGRLQEGSLVDKTSTEIPDFDQAEHDRLFQKRTVNGVPHWTAPHQMTARQILSTHRLEGESKLMDRSEIYRNKMADLLVPKYGQLTAQQAKFHEEDAVVNSVSKFGAGTGAGLDDHITKHGYDWTKPILVSTQGIPPEHTQGMVGQDRPHVANGGHRLMWMFTHHPDVPIPIDADIHRIGTGTYEHVQTVNDAVYNGLRPEDLEAVKASEEQMDSKKASDWRDSMAKAYPEKYGNN